MLTARDPGHRFGRSRSDCLYVNLATRPLPDNLKASICPTVKGRGTPVYSLLLSLRPLWSCSGASRLSSIGACVHRAWAVRSLRRLFPLLRHLLFESGWLGTIGRTSDNLPCLRKLDRNVIAFTGYNGQGIAPGTVFCLVLAHYSLGQTLNMSCRFRILPLEYTAFLEPGRHY